MKISPIETMITAALEGCKYESDVSKAWQGLDAKIKAVFPEASMAEIMYYWEKVSIAKKKSIRRNTIG